MPPFSHPSWDFEDSASEAEIDFNDLQPFELAQQSLRPERKRSAHVGGPHPPTSALASSSSSSQAIPAGPNQPGMQRSRSFGDVLGGRPTTAGVEEDVRRGASTTVLGNVPALSSPVGQQQPTTSSGAPPCASPVRPVRPRAASGSGLNRSQTLLSHTASPQRSSHELSRLLAKSPSSRKLGGDADGRADDDARLEAGRRKARVTLDVDLEREILVEGGDVKGTMIVVVRPGPKKEGPVHVGLGKIRLVGFEDVPSHAGRHIFYHHSATLPLFTPGDAANQHRSSLFTATPGTHHPSHPGSHPIPFHLPLPLTDFPRGPHRSASSAIRYILIGSLSLFFPFTGQSSIAHFYRNIVIYPRIDPSRVLGSAGGNAVENARSFGNPAGRGVELGVKVGKAVWVAGMSCWVDISMYNGTSKKIKSLTVQLWQTTVLYHPSLTSTRPNSLSGNLDPGSTSTKSKKMAETVLAEAQASGKGLITGKGWFSGCAPTTAGTWSTSLLLPPDALSIPRGRLIEVGYTIRVCIDSKVYVEVPIRIVNFISIDPPPSTYRPPMPVTAVPANLAARRGLTAAPVAAAALPTDAAPHDSPKSAYTDGLIGYDTISRPRMPHGPTSSLASGTLASTLKKARSMGSLAFPGEMGNRTGASTKGPLRVANRGSSSSSDEDDDASDVDDGEGRGLIRRKVSMAVLKEAVDAAARETDGYGDVFDEEDAYGYAYNDDDVDLGVDIPKLVEASTHIAAGDTIDEADEETLASGHFEDPLDDRNRNSGFGDGLLPSAIAESSPKSQTLTILSDEGAFAYDDRRSLAPLSNLPTPMEEQAFVLSEFPIPALPLAFPVEESTESIGEAMQSMLLDDADSDESENELASAAALGGAPRFPEGRGRAPSPMLQAARAASLTVASPPTAAAGLETRGGERPASRLSQQHPSLRLNLAWGGASTIAGGRPTSTYEPTYEEVRNALTQSRHSAATTPEPAFRSNGRLSINTDLIHPEAMQKPRTPSPTPGSESPSVSVLTPSPAAVTPASPAKSISKRKSFSFASPAAPIRVKTTMASARDGAAPPRPPRLRSSTSSVSLRRTAAEDSPVRAKAPSSAFVGSTSPTKSGYASTNGRESPTKADAWFGSPHRSRTLHASPASPLKVAPAAREVPGLADARASSDSGSNSEATPPLESAAFPPPVSAISFADKLQFTNRHLSQHFDPCFDALRAGGPPRANSVDLQSPMIRGSPRSGGSAARPSVKSKVQRLESRQAAHLSVTAELGLPPALRRSATTASPRYGPSDDLKFVRPGHHRKESSISSETADALVAESNLRRAPSGVSFKAPLLRHSKSMAGNPHKDS